MNMNALVRNTTVRFSGRFNGYQHLDQTHGSTGDEHDHDDGHLQTLSRRKNVSLRSRRQVIHPTMMTPFSYKRERARKRHIFLQSYKLTSLKSTRKFRPPKKLKKAAIKVKSLLVSVLALMRAASLKTCNSRNALDASSPARIQR